MLGCKLDREGEGTTPKTTVLICFLLLQQNTRSYVLCKERSSLSLCVGRLKVQDPAAPLVRPLEDSWLLGTSSEMNHLSHGEHSCNELSSQEVKSNGFPTSLGKAPAMRSTGTCSGSWTNGCSSLNIVCPSKASPLEDGFSAWQSCWGGRIWRLRPTWR